MVAFKKSIRLAKLGCSAANAVITYRVVEDLECYPAVGTGVYAHGGIYTLKFIKNAGKAPETSIWRIFFLFC